MLKTVLGSKIHRATVTQADLNYVGSLTVDSLLMRAARLVPGERVSVVDVTNGTRLETYLIEGVPGSGVIGVNGAAAHLIHVGDIIIIMSYNVISHRKAAKYLPFVVHVDEKNTIRHHGKDPAEARSKDLSAPDFSLPRPSKYD